MKALLDLIALQKKIQGTQLWLHFLQSNFIPTLKKFQPTTLPWVIL